MEGSSAGSKCLNHRKRAFPGIGTFDLEKDEVDIFSDDSDPEELKKLIKRRGKQKEVMFQEVIDIGEDGCWPDTYGVNNKTKDLIYVSVGDDSDDIVMKEPLITKKHSSSSHHGTAGIVIGKKPKNCSKSSTQGYVDNFNYFHEDSSLEPFPGTWSGMDDVSYLQAQFDLAGIPTGIEASIPWWSEPAQNNGNSVYSGGLSLSGTADPFSVLESDQAIHSLGLDLNLYGGTAPFNGLLSANGSKLSRDKHKTVAYDNLELSLSRDEQFHSGQLPVQQKGSDVPDSTRSSRGDPRTSSLPMDSSGEDTGKKLQQFDNFVIVEDYSDHHFATMKEHMQPSRAWAKKIQDEWKILKSSLPDTIFVRAYESRMDLLRAVIVGPEGTPYHDGLFFFDVYFPSSYPSTPPQVYYHSGGLRLNPNLYNCGKVCLSLLGTWPGQRKTENWLPDKSTLLQVLVSIQAIILNAEPYYNEPGWANSGNTTAGQKAAAKYNERTLILSLKTMQYSMRRSPKHFENFVRNHFVASAQDILLACKAYIDGAQVGSLSIVEGKAVSGKKKKSSPELQQDVKSILNSLIEDLTKVGAKNCAGFRVQESDNIHSAGTSGSKSSHKSKSSEGSKSKSGVGVKLLSQMTGGSTYPYTTANTGYIPPFSLVSGMAAPPLTPSPPWNPSMLSLPQPPPLLMSHQNYGMQMPMPMNPSLNGNVYKWSDTNL